MDSRCFMFDLVILNVWVPEFDYENNCLTLEVTFNETEFTIEPNPDKPGEFKQGRTCEFEAYPDELRIDLLERPLKIKLKSNGAELIGEAELIWPQDMLEKLEKDQFMQYSHFDQCDIKKEYANTGKVGIQYRLRAKCEGSDIDKEREDKPCDIQSELKRIINPNELFFLIQNDSDICSAVNAEDKKPVPCPTSLDLSKFKNFHGKVVTDPGVFDQVYSLDCCHTKKFPTECKSKSTVCMNPGPSCPQVSKCDDSKTSMEWACKATQHVRECPHSNKFSDETTGSCSCDCPNECGGDLKQDIFNNGKMKNICQYPESPPVLKETVYVRPRLCPVCNSDVSWLPKLAACPKCGHKPTPYAVERPYNENLTADQILEEWADDNTKQGERAHHTAKISRCTCKNGKVCAYCRIRKLCKDVIKTKKCRDPAAKPSTDSAATKDTADQICKSNSGTESRTYLARVFSELRDLYNLKADMKKRRFEMNAPCEKSFNMPKNTRSKDTGRQRSATNVNSQGKKLEMTKNVSPEKKAKWCKGKVYNYTAVRKYPGNLIGHKTCVCSGKSVPKNMGWLWNCDTVGNRRGWKPGAIRKPIKEIMKYFLKDFPVDSLRVSRYSRKGVAKKDSEELVQKPTLHICKKNGVYIITMRPLKDASMLRECADPYVPMKPIRFKIVKNPIMVHGSQMKKQLKKTFHKCTCHKPISQCYCRSYLDKKRLEFELNKACRQKGIPSLKDTLVLSDTTDSEVEFDFGVTPPAGVIKPQLKNKPDLACHETQYNEKDCVMKAIFPAPLNKYMKPYDSTGGRMGAGGATGRGGPTGHWGPDGRWIPTSAGRSGGSGAGGPGGTGGRNSNRGWTTGTTARGGIGSGPGGTNPPPLFCNLARRRKPDPCSCGPPPCMPCLPIC